MSEEQYEDTDEMLDGIDDTAIPAYGIASAAGGALATAAGIAAEVAAAPVALAAGAGVAIGTGIEWATDGAISDGISDGLMGLVGEEESYKATQAFDDGDWLEGVGHMAVGAGGTVAEAAEGAWDTATDVASDAVDAVGEAAEDTWDAVTDFFS